MTKVEPGDLSWLIPTNGRGRLLFIEEVTGDLSWLDKVGRESVESVFRSKSLRFSSGLLLWLESGVDLPLPLMSPSWARVELAALLSR